MRGRMGSQYLPGLIPIAEGVAKRMSAPDNVGAASGTEPTR